MQSRITRRGFTLLELTVVLMIAGVVGSISAGRIHALMVQQRIVRAATVVQNNIESAFATAGRNRQPVRISWNASTMQLLVTDRAGTRVYRRIALGRDPYGLSAADVSVSRSPLEIYPNGLANDTLTIAMSGNGETKRVRVSRAGLVQIQ